MKRLLTLSATAALGLLALVPGVASAAPQSPQPQPTNTTPVPLPPPVIAFNHKPVFNDYLACFNGFVYTDFRDPDGDDALMSVQMKVYRPGTGWTYHAMTNTGPTVHGVFWWTELADHGINPATVTAYAFRATDQAGLKSSWVSADGDCALD
jgi:hypothetical protein